MALSDANKDYLDTFANPPGAVILVNTLKEVIVDAQVTELKAKIKDWKISRLEADKTKIDAKILELNK